MEFIGRRFGHIRITDVVGQGGMGDVYVGYDEKLDRKVALKVLHAENRLDAESRERLLREARALSKLDHPNICRIHDYIESSDVDVLVLEYIDGETLQDVVLDRQLSRGEKLRIALAVTDVLVAVHRVGIIHRDLKPENVMITKRGDVKVLDFGLARWLNVIASSRRLRAVTSAEAAAGAPVADESHNLWFSVDDSSATALQGRDGQRFHGTAMGMTMGTPLYMSPEQARGDELTTASDMYALGLVLQFLFTGLDPHPPGLTAREVILRAARGEKVAAAGVPGDVAALIGRLDQFAPADRPTANETVARLKFLGDKPRRLARRGAIALAVLVVIVTSWRYASDLSRERTIAVAARAEAETRRAQAENLIEFMLGDLRKKLVPVGRLDILDDVGERALQYVGSLQPEAMSAGELTRNSKALNQLGEVRVGQGKLSEALDVFRRSLTLAELAAKKEPGSAPAQLAVATSHFWIGNVHQQQGTQQEALRHYTRYMTIAEQLAKSDPMNDEYQLERAYGHGNVGTILETQGDLRGALEHYRTSFEIKNAQLQRNPGDANARVEVARAVNKVGRVQQRLGDFAGARAQFENEVDTYRHLLRSDPKQSYWKQRLAASLGFLGTVRGYLGDPAGALECAEEELALDTELAALDPENVEWQRNLAVASWRMADLVRVNGDVPRALDLCARAGTVMRHAVAKVPSRREWLNELAGIDTSYARALSTAGQGSRAMTTLLGVIRSLETSGASADPFRLADAWFDAGEIYRARGDRAAAIKAWSNANEQLRDVSLTSTDARRISLWIRTLARLGRVDEGRFARARLREIGYRSVDLEQVCKDEGC